MESGSNTSKHDRVMQPSPSAPDNGENKMIPAERPEAGPGVAGSSASSSKQPIVALQVTGLTKGINFLSSASSAQAPVLAVSANSTMPNNSSTSLNLTRLNSLARVNLIAARPDNHTATITPAPSPVPGDLSFRNHNSFANLSLNSSEHRNSSAATVTGTDNVDSGNDTAHVPFATLNPVSRRHSSDKIAHSAGMRYRECLKNHAANMGGYAVDGCGEFMPSGEEGSLEALKCAACGCHRNFHRREANGGSSITGGVSKGMSLLALPSTIVNPSSTSTSTSNYGEGYHHHNDTNSTMVCSGAEGPFSGSHYNAGQIGSILTHSHVQHHHQYMQHAWLQGGQLTPRAGASAGHHAGGLPVHYYGHSQGPGGQYPYVSATGGHGAGCMGSGGSHMIGTAGKRFRTKFTMDQREKMFEFSEKVGWRIQKQDDAAVQQFCAEAGIKRHVLKVWMHNNKNTFGKKLLRFPEAFTELPRSNNGSTQE